MTIQSMFTLENKTALVTGAAMGLGRQIALTLAKAGAKVILLDKLKEKLENVAEEVRALGLDALTEVVDLSDPKAIQRTIKHIIEKTPDIDILVNNAGIGGANPVLSTDFEQALEHIDSYYAVNLRAPWLLSHQIAQQMIKKNIAGSIINISSGCGDRAPGSRNAIYSATKAGLAQMTRSMSLELGPKKIRVNAILPGFFNTPMAQQDLNSEHFDAGGFIPLGFVANPEDISATILYLASNTASAYVTGSLLAIDGGASVSPFFRK